MIEFKLEDRRLRLIDGVFYARAFNNKGEETRNEIWRKMLFNDNGVGYLICGLTLNKVKHKLSQHRLVWYAHHQDWNIWDTSRDNQIDHINKIRNDNRIANLHIVTNAENQQNQDCKGCYFIEALNKWKAQITIDGKQKYIGLYDTYEEGHEAYLAEKRILHPFFVEDE